MARTAKSMSKRGKKAASGRKTSSRRVSAKAKPGRKSMSASSGKSTSKRATAKTAGRKKFGKTALATKKRASARSADRVSVKSRSPKGVLPKAVEGVKRLARKAERMIENTTSTH